MAIFHPGFELLKNEKELPVWLNASSSSFSCMGFASSKNDAKWVSKQQEQESSTSQYMSKEIRKLVANSYQVFMHLSQLKNERDCTQRELESFEVVKASRAYREALKTCIFSMEDQSSSIQNEEEEEEFLDLLKVSLAIWHLCELLFFQRRPRDEKSLAYELAQWLQEHYASAHLETLEATSERLKNDSNPENDPDYWSTIYSLIMMGDGHAASILLASHSSMRANLTASIPAFASTTIRKSFNTIQRLLVSMPGGSRSYHEQQGPAPATVEWKNWHDACQYVLSSDPLVSSDPQLKTLLHLLIADEPSLQQNAKSWYELMMARLFLEEPKKISHRFEFLMANCFQAFQLQMGTFDCIILAILQYDVQSALKDVNTLGLSWMAAHLSDLFVKSHVLSDEILDPLGCSLVEYFVLIYALEIGTTKGFWQVTLGYYQACPVFGSIGSKGTLKKEQVNLSSEFKTHRLMSFALNNKTQTRDIATKRALYCQQKKQYGTALLWLLRVGQAEQVDRICDLILDQRDEQVLNEAVEFLEGGYLNSMEMTREKKHTGNTMFRGMTQKLLWLVRYREFSLVLEDITSLEQEKAGENQDQEILLRLRFVQNEACKRIFLLLEKFPSKWFLYEKILKEIEKFLQIQPTLFHSQHLYAIMAFVNELERSFDAKEWFLQASNKRQIHRIRALIPRNLSESILQEAGTGFVSMSHGQSSSSMSFSSSSASASVASRTAAVTSLGFDTNGISFHP